MKKRATENSQVKYVIYRRVSTQKQGVSGLGLEAQAATVQSFLRSQPDAVVIVELTEVESGKSDQRPVLAECIRLCKLNGATLLVSTLSRLTRSLAFLTQIEASGIPIRCADMPEMNNLVLHILGSINHYEAELVSTRTSNALQALKARGVKLGNPRIAEAREKANSVRKTRAVERNRKYLALIEEIKAKAGVSTLPKIAEALNLRGIFTARGAQWTAAHLHHVLNFAA
jgi:DNA invertase Pin-like site-specific DNA recombinase